jgi:hypothetical protein
MQILIITILDIKNSFTVVKTESKFRLSLTVNCFLTGRLHMYIYIFYKLGMISEED